MTMGGVMKTLEPETRRDFKAGMISVMAGLLMMLLPMVSLTIFAGEDPPPLTNEIGFGIGSGCFSKGLISVPAAQWTGSSPALNLSLSRESGRFSHNLGLCFGRAVRINRGGHIRPGDNSFSWMPAQYSFTWYAASNVFHLARLDWGFGATIQWIRFREEIDLQTGHQTSHDDDLLGLGMNTGFRWRSAGAGLWRALANLSITIAFPPLNRSAYRSDLVPDYHGGAFWGAVGLLITVERRIARHWGLGVVYQRNAVFLLRTLEKRFAIAEMYSAGNFLIAQLALQIRYKW